MTFLGLKALVVLHTSCGYYIGLIPKSSSISWWLPSTFSNMGYELPNYAKLWVFQSLNAPDFK